MSLLQEYEEIKRMIGKKRYENISKYLEEHTEVGLDNLYYSKKHWYNFLLWEEKQEKDPKRKKRLKAEIKEFGGNKKYPGDYGF